MTRQPMTLAKVPAHPGLRLPRDKPMSIRAYFLGERLQLRDLYDPPWELGPLALPAGQQGLALLFRYGAVVLINLSEAEHKQFLKELHPRIERPLRKPETEEATLLPAGKQLEGVVPEGIALSDFSLPRLQVVAIVLARSAALAYYETTMAHAFDLIEPLARRLEQPGGTRRLRELLRHIGSTLLVQQRLIGRVEIQDKPDLLWDHPELERLYLKLENEYELAERNTVLERKLALINHTAETAVNLLQNRSMLRVEWYIVILIVVEVLLYGYELLLRH